MPVRFTYFGLQASGFTHVPVMTRHSEVYRYRRTSPCFAFQLVIK